MTPPQLLETAVAIAVHATVVVVAVELLTRRLSEARKCDLFWTACHLALIVVIVGDLTMPHLRLWAMPLVITDTLPQIRQLESSLGLIITGVWAAGAAAAVVRLLVGSLGTVRRFKTGRPLAPEELPEAWRKKIERGRAMPMEVRFLSSDLCSSPFCWQLHRPTVILPQALLKCPVEDLAPVIRHELEHLQLGHPLCLFLQRLVGILLWFHPAVWWAGRQAHLYREFACDDAAVHNRDEAVGYLRCLLQLARSADEQQKALTGLSFGGRRSLIAQRSERLASRTWQARLSGGGTWSCAIPVLLGMLLVLVAWIPLDGRASRRSVWSPWPQWTARSLMSLGVEVRDYEIDGHRFSAHERHTHRRPYLPSARPR
jgi:beta-lactamase regulating signal transducer with metallopeptidase domain